MDRATLDKFVPIMVHGIQFGTGGKSCALSYGHIERSTICELVFIILNYPQTTREIGLIHFAIETIRKPETMVHLSILRCSMTCALLNSVCQMLATRAA